MKCIYILLFLSPFFSMAQNWRQQCDMVIDVTLQESDNTLDGLVRMNYKNNSPDSLSFIWIHLWPNAYKNDQTAFSEQLLQNGRTDFYFSSEAQRGYINRLDFRSGQEALDIEDHPLYIDIVKLVLPKPLAPGDSMEISTPFHVKLPYRFSRSGYTEKDLAVTQWFPKPAVYDSEGWHPMPYLDQGEFYAEFGNYDVTIHVPKDYIIAATGELQGTAWWREEDNSALKERLRLQGEEKLMTQKGKVKPGAHKNSKVKPESPIKKYTSAGSSANTQQQSSLDLQSLRYIQENVIDFAWFASKYYIEDQGKTLLTSGKEVDVYAYYFPEDSASWKVAVSYAKDAIQFRSQALGEYPYAQVSVVHGKDNFSGGMEYPGITLLSGQMAGPMLDFIIEHEIGHNWFQGILSTNEREHPWMDEGMNTYFDYRYLRQKYGSEEIMMGIPDNESSISRKLPENFTTLLLEGLESIGHGQPINAPSDEFTKLNNGIVPYHKTALWLEILEKEVGRETMDRVFKTYYQSWKFRHPSPGNFRKIFDSVSGGQKLDSLYALSGNPGSITTKPSSKKIKPTFFFNLKNTDSIEYINLLPYIGYNRYDKLMPGLILHNYYIPKSRFNFLLAPSYGTGSGTITGLGHLQYSFPLKGRFSKLVVGGNLMHYSRRAALDTLGDKMFENFSRLGTIFKLEFKEPSLRSSVRRTLEFKTFFIRENDFAGFANKYGDSSFTIYVTRKEAINRYINQLTFKQENNRVLYPYDWSAQVQQGKGFYRFNLEGNHFFNYAKYGGLTVRFFASRFGYLGGSLRNDPSANRFMPKLTGVNGEEDFTYSNYFAGRSASVASSGESVSNGGFAARQIMNRDGGLKMRLDYFDFLHGRSDDWVTALNLSTTLPAGLLPIKLPLKLFVDFGTSAPYWKDSYTGSRFLYVGGVQLSVFRGLVNIYAPLLYSKDIRENLESVPEENKFARKLSFSIDIQRFNIRRYSGNQIPL